MKQINNEKLNKAKTKKLAEALTLKKQFDAIAVTEDDKDAVAECFDFLNEAIHFVFTTSTNRVVWTDDDLKQAVFGDFDMTHMYGEDLFVDIHPDLRDLQNDIVETYQELRVNTLSFS